jgi:hypothetical protein
MKMVTVISAALDHYIFILKIVESIVEQQSKQQEREV